MTKEETKEYMRNWREANKEKMKKYKENNKDSYCNSKEYRRLASLKFREQNYELFLLMQIKSSAKKRKKEFNLTIEDIIIPIHCPYLGIELTKSVGMGLLDSAPSVDRIDTTKGYIKGNIRIISHLANKMKSNVSIDMLVLFANNILTLQSK